MPLALTPGLWDRCISRSPPSLSPEAFAASPRPPHFRRQRKREGPVHM